MKAMILVHLPPTPSDGGAWHHSHCPGDANEVSPWAIRPPRMSQVLKVHRRQQLDSLFGLFRDENS